MINRNREIENQQRRVQFDEQDRLRREAEEKAILDENPNQVKYFQTEKDKILQTKEYMLAKATEFYDLKNDDIDKYATLPHGADNSAVKHLL